MGLLIRIIVSLAMTAIILRHSSRSMGLLIVTLFLMTIGSLVVRLLIDSVFP